MYKMPSLKDSAIMTFTLTIGKIFIHGQGRIIIDPEEFFRSAGGERGAEPK